METPLRLFGENLNFDGQKFTKLYFVIGAAFNLCVWVHFYEDFLGPGSLDVFLAEN